MERDAARQNAARCCSTGRPLRPTMERSTSGNDPTAESSTDRVVDTLAASIARSFTLGVDGDGFDHHYYQPADSVVVYDGRELDRVVYLDGRPLEEYVQFVAASERGWARLGQFASLGISVDAARKGAGVCERAC